MKINERWAITGGKGDFVVTETKPGINPKTRQPTTSKKTVFYPTLEQCAAYIARTHCLEACEQERLEDAIAAMNSISRDIRELISEKA